MLVVKHLIKFHTEKKAIKSLKKQVHWHISLFAVRAVWRRTPPSQGEPHLILPHPRHPVPGIARHLMPPQVDPNEIWQSWDQWSFLSDGGFLHRRFSPRPDRGKHFHCWELHCVDYPVRQSLRENRSQDQGWTRCQSLSVIDRRVWQLLSREVSPGPLHCKHSEQKETGSEKRASRANEEVRGGTFAAKSSLDPSWSCSLWWAQTGL